MLGIASSSTFRVCERTRTNGPLRIGLNLGILPASRRSGSPGSEFIPYGPDSRNMGISAVYDPSHPLFIWPYPFNSYRKSQPPPGESVRQYNLACDSCPQWHGDFRLHLPSFFIIRFRENSTIHGAGGEKREAPGTITSASPTAQSICTVPHWITSFSAWMPISTSCRLRPL